MNLDLILKAKSGCLKSQNKLLIQYNSLLKSRATKFLRRHANDTIDDLYQEGCIGFLHGCRNYDPEKGKFKTYVTYWVDAYLQRYNSRLIKIPNYIREFEYRYYQAQGKIDKGMGAEQACKESQIPKDKFDLLSQSLNFSMLSVDYDMDSGMSIPLPDKDSKMPEDLLVEQETTSQLLSLIGTLTEKQQIIIKNKYGLEGLEPLNKLEIAKILGCQRSNIYYSYDKGMTALRKRFLELNMK